MILWITTLQLWIHDKNTANFLEVATPQILTMWKELGWIYRKAFESWGATPLQKGRMNFFSCLSTEKNNSIKTVEQVLRSFVMQNSTLLFPHSQQPLSISRPHFNSLSPGLFSLAFYYFHGSSSLFPLKLTNFYEFFSFFFGFFFPPPLLLILSFFTFRDFQKGTQGRASKVYAKKHGSEMKMM